MACAALGVSPQAEMTSGSEEGEVTVAGGDRAVANMDISQGDRIIQVCIVDLKPVGSARNAVGHPLVQGERILRSQRNGRAIVRGGGGIAQEPVGRVPVQGEVGNLEPEGEGIDPSAVSVGEVDGFSGGVQGKLAVQAREVRICRAPDDEVALPIDLCPGGEGEFFEVGSIIAQAPAIESDGGRMGIVEFDEDPEDVQPALGMAGSADEHEREAEEGSESVH